MDFRLSQEARQKIIDRPALKKNIEFCCLTQSEKARGLKANFLVILEDGFSELQVLEFIIYSNIRNFVQNSYWSAVDKLATLLSLADKQNTFFEEQFCLFPDAEMKFTLKFNAETDRTQLTKEAFANMKMSIGSNRTAHIQQTIDELAMNAQFTAPNSGITQNSRDSILIIEKNKTLVGISVVDYYGTLDINKFLKKIEHCLKFGKGESINYSQGGAGLGASIIYTHSDLIMLGCEKGKRTRVTSVLPYNINENNFSYIQKSICIIDSGDIYE